MKRKNGTRDAYDTGYAPTDAAAGGHQPKEPS